MTFLYSAWLRIVNENNRVCYKCPSLSLYNYRGKCFIASSLYSIYFHVFFWRFQGQQSAPDQSDNSWRTKWQTLFLVLVSLKIIWLKMLQKYPPINWALWFLNFNFYFTTCFTPEQAPLQGILHFEL